ncbi:MAG TPA: hypothetical protein VJP81_05785 [Candidatus Dormibacteraeota bacterium]|nr:hypothetical protein [Candidatus Dormibacteraeota bacterium]
MSAQDLGLIGIWLLVASAVLIIIELSLAGLWSVRLSRRARELSEQMRREQAQLQADVERLEESLAEAIELWQPYGRLLRWLRHPLTIALLQSYARRRATVR